jgi:MFS transporter, DHA1 family, tetracycline resistance protein
MFRSPKDYRTFLTILLTYILDLLGFSIAFPVLAPLLLNPELHFVSAGTAVTERTTILGLLFALFGIAQFFGSPAAGVLADHYGRYKAFLATIGLSIFGYAMMAVSLYLQDLNLLFAGRILTGFCSGNFALAQSATADLTDETHRPRAFGILAGVGGLGFVAGPWLGGKLANPHWLSGSGAFIFAGLAALINLLAIFFFFEETRKPHHKKSSLLQTFKDMRLVFHQKNLRNILTTSLIFSIGWAFFPIFSPTFLVQKFSLGPDRIGDIFAYMALIWFFISMFVNKELIGYFSLRTLILVGIILSAFGVAFFVWPSELWPYWFIIPVAMTGGALAWVNLSTKVSLRATSHMQGRAMGALGSSWAIAQIVAPLAAGPLSGWNIYSPLLLGAIIILLSFFYFFIAYRE